MAKCDNEHVEELDSKEAVVLELKSFWSSRSAQHRIAILGAFVASVVFVGLLAVVGNRPQMSLLYSGLDEAQAASVLSALDQSGAKYELRGGSIWIDDSVRDRMRLDLAAQNLPRMGTAGYEILDEMSGFGTTSQMFDAAYWRAKEGELARTILSVPSVKSARVHLSPPRSRGYRDPQPGAASVTLVSDGSAIGTGQARAMRFLIASAVPGLTPESVSVIDSARGVISDTADGTEVEREAQMKHNIERILAARVGAGNAIVELNIDRITDSEQVTERRIDPSQRTLISEETEELTDESTMRESGAVTAASNLPEKSDAGQDSQQSQRAETRLRANYEVGTVTRQLSRTPGGIRRLTVAVLVNGVETTLADGKTVIEPRSDAELATIRDLVAAAVGLDESRGDELTVKSMVFAEVAGLGTVAKSEPSLMDRLAINSLARVALIGLLGIAAFAMISRAMGRGSSGEAKSAPELLDTSAPPAPAESEPELPALDLGTPDMPMLTMAAADFDFDSPGGSEDDPSARLRKLVTDRHDETIQMLSGWISDNEGAAT